MYLKRRRLRSISSPSAVRPSKIWGEDLPIAVSRYGPPSADAPRAKPTRGGLAGLFLPTPLHGRSQTPPGGAAALLVAGRRPRLLLLPSPARPQHPPHPLIA